MKHIKILILFFVTLLTLLSVRKYEINATNVTNFNSNQQHQITELNDLILKELNKHKIVMLGDAYHGHGFFMYKVSKFLDYWLDQFDNTKNVKAPAKLVLFLEENNEVASEINKFIDSGDISSFLRYYIEYDSQVMSNVFSIDYCIFLHQLQQIKQRIEKIMNPIVELKIIGAESKPPYDMNQITKDSKEEFLKKKSVYFAYERDRMISKNIQNFLENNPDFKAIVFYGGAHLIREKVNKKHYLNDQRIKEDMYSYFLAHYLDSLYTRNNVCVFYERPIFDFQYENIFKPQSEIDKPDYFVSTKPYPNHPLSMLFARSKTYLKALNDIVSKYEGKKTAAGRKIYQILALKFSNAIMHTYLHEYIENKTEIRKIAKEVINKSKELLTKYDIVQSLTRCNEGITLNVMHNDFYNKELANMLSNIPSFQIDVRNNNALENDQLSPTMKQKIKDLGEDISTYLAIHTLFIADHNESDQILKYLKEKSKLEYNTKMEWFNWWQIKYLNN